MEKIPVSIGEIFDKYSILEIKNEKISDIEKLKHVKKEIEYLKPIINKYNIDKEYSELKNINLKLWDIEDNIRIKHFKNEFDMEFISYAKSVYITNDKRAEIKKKINNLVDSEICEVKKYINYQHN